jgi:hypothetical protein
VTDVSRRTSAARIGIEALSFVNQNFVVIAGFTNASNTSETGLRISMPVFMTGMRVVCRLSMEASHASGAVIRFMVIVSARPVSSNVCNQ